MTGRIGKRKDVDRRDDTHEQSNAGKKTRKTVDSTENSNKIGTPSAEPKMVEDVAIPRLMRFNSIESHINSFRFKAMVLNKSDIREFGSSFKKSQLFTCDLIDEDKAVIRCTAFSNSCIKYHNALLDGSIYVFTGALIKIANPIFNNSRNKYEVELIDDTEIITTDEKETITVPVDLQCKDFVKCDALDNCTVDQTVDMRGSINRIGNLIEWSSANSSGIRREVYITDDTNACVKVLFWGNAARNFAYDVGDTVELRNCRVKAYNGIFNLSMNATSNIKKLDVFNHSEKI